MKPNTMLMLAPDALDQALEAVADEQLPIAERGAIYAGLRRLRLAIDRALRPVTKEIEMAMVQADAREWGPLRLTWKAIDPKYPVNDEGNWDDAIVQGFLADWRRQSAYRPFIREIPKHYEIDVTELGKAVANGDPGARELFGLLKEHRFRVEAGRAPSLTVVESRVA